MSNPSQREDGLAWSQADVFAEAPLEGNMLAIFHDGTHLSTDQMQALARETNLSETTFILPRDEAVERAEGVRVRIFTTREELPFAGHPTLGTASFLWLHHPIFRGAAEVPLALQCGRIAVRFHLPGDEGGRGVLAEMTQVDPVFGERPEPSLASAALGLSDADLHPDLAPQVVSTGLPFLIVPLRTSEAVGRVAIDSRALTALLASCGAHFVYAIAPIRESVSQPTWHARMPFYGGDDPATGSAAGCAISYLVRNGVAAPDETVTIRQGMEVGRPSTIVTKASLHEGSVRNVRVRGRTVFVASGRFFLA